MLANVETMFYVRETPWHGLGTKVLEATDSKEALIAAGLDWNVIQEPIYTEENEPISGYKANIRDSDRRVCILRSLADSDAFQSGRCAAHNGRPETLAIIN